MINKLGEPRKVRWTVPAADTSVNTWLEKQESISVSLRLLIRESIQRDGYIDVMNRSVDQLPRRGRPTAGERGSDDTASATESIKVVGDVDGQRGREMVSAVLVEHRGMDEDQARRTADEIFDGEPNTSNERAKPDPETRLPAAGRPAGSEDETPDSSDESAGDGQVDINDIMAGLRN